MRVLVDIHNPTSIEYHDVFEDGDIWVKTQGCEACPKERRVKCCGNCYNLTSEALCRLQCNGKHSAKPFYCVVAPTPADVKCGCAMEFQCVKGADKGKIRRVKDRKGEFCGSC